MLQVGNIYYFLHVQIKEPLHVNLDTLCVILECPACYNIFLYVFSQTVPGDNRGFTVDISQASSVDKLFTDVRKAFNQPPCCIVNCAGITRDSLLLKMDEKDFDAVMQVNLKVSKQTPEC